MDNIIESAIKKLESVAIDPFPTLNPILGVILKPEDKEAQSYLRSLEKNAAKYKSVIKTGFCDNTQDASLQIRQWAQDSRINGIIIISSYDKATQSLYDMIPMRLDVDGLSYKSIGRLYGSDDPIAYRKAPCTAVACLKIIQELYGSKLEGLKIAVIGRSMRVGRPLAELLIQQNCTVTLYHSKSNLSSWLGYNDVIVSAIGKPKYWNRKNLKPAAKYLIDVGINFDSEGKLCGDIDAKDFEDSAAYISPVPNGVGAVTNTVLFAKLYANKRDFFGVDMQ